MSRVHFSDYCRYKGGRFSPIIKILRATDLRKKKETETRKIRENNSRSVPHPITKILWPLRGFELAPAHPPARFDHSLFHQPECLAPLCRPSDSPWCHTERLFRRLHLPHLLSRFNRLCPMLLHNRQSRANLCSTMPRHVRRGHSKLWLNSANGIGKSKINSNRNSN